MATPATSHPGRRAGCILYKIDPCSGAAIEIFYADGTFAQSFGARGAGFYWRKRDCSPDVPNGPFVVCLDAYRDALDGALQNGADRDAVA
jgi:hypothetical protein